MKLKVGKYYLDNDDNICYVKSANSGGFVDAPFYVNHYNVYSDGGLASYFHREDGSVNLVYCAKNFHKRNIIKELSPEDYPELYI